ncbi:hypothetical protein RKE30_30110 [Streptomyces sp. Li-HN-5-11]|uniref:hypothetical protein n=1 Tax=Streptomyces sp. Li-HN-5-11 TaxID=3075432 RepID=UPI0028AA01EC|nr:hypothetical protein [Streptomyces sp. Li-HN-5-11]WNM34317.1 hypothetical protein RKE30_30110 [Streptomyces sp. Li-HN-5-11]
MTMPRDGHEELRARLHEAAGAHEPDRARILARVERGMADHAPHTRPGHRASRLPVVGWMRVVGTTAAVAGVLAVGGYAVASAVKDDTGPRETVAVSPTPSSSRDATRRAPAGPADPVPSAPQHTTTPHTPPAPSPKPSSTARPPAAGEQDGPLWSDGSVDPHSNDFWAQSDITLKTSEPLTALTVRLKVARTAGVSSTGAWRTLPEGDFTLTTVEQDGFLVYTWILKQGRTVPAGEWVFAGQYNHERGGRDARDDGYTATAVAQGRQLSVAGDFAAHEH